MVNSRGGSTGEDNVLGESTPTPSELETLTDLVGLWAADRTAYGPTTAQLVRRGRMQTVSDGATRANLTRLLRKGLVDFWDRRRVGGQKTWEPTLKGRLAVYEVKFPGLEKR